MKIKSIVFPALLLFLISCNQPKRHFKLAIAEPLRHSSIDEIKGDIKINNEEQKRFSVRLGLDYPNPIVDVRKWIKG